MEELQSLVTRTQGGDLDAYGLIVRRFQDMAYAYAFSMLGDFHQAQDAAQNAFIQAYQEIGSLRESVAFPGWFRRIVYTECAMMARRKCVPSVSLDSVVDVVSSESGPAEMAERSELARRVQTAIRELPDAQRVVTTLFYINGYSHQDIAEFLEVPARTVKSRLHASRGRLRERMIDMVEDELKANKLPEQFTKETVEQAVARAKALNEESKYNEAEEVLREVIANAPGDAGLLKVLNRAVAQGRVYGQGRFDMLSEIAEYGRIILQTTDDEYMHHEMARTLLAIPAMPEAIAFIEEWIAKKGPNLERLGMLAWANGCVADYETAAMRWEETLAIAKTMEPDAILPCIPFIAYTLVDCFATAGELARAQRVGRQAWGLCSEMGAGEKLIWYNDDGNWMSILHLAQMDLREYCETVLAGFPSEGDARTEARRLYVRNGIDSPDEAVLNWVEWVRECVSDGEWALLKEARGLMLRAFEERGMPDVPKRIAEGVFGIVKLSDAKEAADELSYWERRAHSFWGAINAGDLDAAEQSAMYWAGKEGMDSEAWLFVHVAAMRGTPLPPEPLQSIMAIGENTLDLHAHYGVARETAAAGDLAKAFDSLRKALSYWTNPPYFAAKVWEADEYWGELRNHPEFKAAFDERRQRIGPIHGMLHYFPAW